MTWPEGAKTKRPNPAPAAPRAEFRAREYRSTGTSWPTPELVLRRPITTAPSDSLSPPTQCDSPQAHPVLASGAKTNFSQSRGFPSLVSEYLLSDYFCCEEKQRPSFQYLSFAWGGTWRKLLQRYSSANDSSRTWENRCKFWNIDP